MVLEKFDNVEFGRSQLKGNLIRLKQNGQKSDWCYLDNPWGLHSPGVVYVWRAHFSTSHWPNYFCNDRNDPALGQTQGKNKSVEQERILFCCEVRQGG